MEPKRKLALYKCLEDVEIDTLNGFIINIKKDQNIEVCDKYFYNHGTTVKKFYFRCSEGEYEWDENMYIGYFIKIYHPNYTE